MKKVVIIAVDAKQQNELIEHIADNYDFKCTIVTASHIKHSIGFNITEDGQLPRAIENHLQILLEVYESIIYDENKEGLYEFQETNGDDGLFHIKTKNDAINYIINYLNQQKTKKK